MKYRKWWLGLLIVILVAGAGFMLLRRGAEDGGTLPEGNARGHNTASTGKAKNPKRPHKATITRLVSQVPGKVILPEVSAEQVERFLTDNHRSAEALLTASRLKDDLSLLREAAAAFPGHALVQLELALRGQTPDEKQQALEAFRKLAPDNAVGDYLAALAHFGRGGPGLAIGLPPGLPGLPPGLPNAGAQGQPEEALEDLAGVEAHPGFGVRSPEQIQSAEDLYRSAGYGLLEAKAAALLGQPRTLTLALNKLSGNLAMLHQKHIAAGDAESAQTMLQMGLALSRRLRGESRLLIDDFVGNFMETRLLKQVPEDAAMPGGGQTASARIEALTNEQQEISELAKQCLPVLEAMTESEVLTYLQHLNQDGELKALRWLQQKSP